MSTKPIYQPLNSEDSHEDSFEALIERFTTYLKARSHKNATLSLYLASARHFLCWLTQQPFGSREIDPKWVREFIEVHLPDCHCPSPAPKSLKTTCGSRIRNFDSGKAHCAILTFTVSLT